MKRITKRAELVELAEELGMRSDWHEPGEQEITARVEGQDYDFDNAGFWPEEKGELHVVLSRYEYNEGLGRKLRTEDVAAVNLATLFAWATGFQGPEHSLERKVCHLEQELNDARQALERAREEIRFAHQLQAGAEEEVIALSKDNMRLTVIADNVGTLADEVAASRGLVS